MLRVNTYLDRSPVHGIGLFAGQKIIAGSMVWEFNPAVDLVYSLAQWDALKASISASSFKNLIRLSYKETGVIYICMDNAQFMNHSEINPNIVQGESKNRMYALRDIDKGEELLCDYLSYSDPDDYHIKNIAKDATKKVSFCSIEKAEINYKSKQQEGKGP